MNVEMLKMESLICLSFDRLRTNGNFSTGFLRQAQNEWLFLTWTGIWNGYLATKYKKQEYFYRSNRENFPTYILRKPIISFRFICN